MSSVEIDSADAAQAADVRVRVWDLPLRMVHWLLPLLLAFSWWSAENGAMVWHTYSGYSLLALVTFRLYWGFAGSTTSRFRHFLRGPRAVWRHLRPTAIGHGGARAGVGHNPLGGWSAMALLALLSAQISLGLFAVDVDGLESGPLSFLVSFDTGRWCAEIHEVVFNVLLGFVALHVGAVAYYHVVRRDNLIAPMVHGRRLVEAALARQIEQDLVPASAWRLVPGAALAVAVVWLVTRGVYWVF